MYEQDAESRTLLRGCAQEICGSIAEAIGHDVLITDLAGVIVGCSDPSRCGTLHVSAPAAIASGESIERSSFSDEYGDAFTGVTSPVRSLNGQVAGTVSIIGDVKVVRPFAVIVRQQVELLLRERELYAWSTNRERTLQSLVKDIGSFVPGVSNEAMLLSRAVEYGYDRARYYVPVAVDLYQFGRFALQVREQMRGQSERAETRIMKVKKAVLASIRKVFSEPRDISAMLGNNRFVVFHAAELDESQEEMAERTRRFAEKLLEMIKALELKAAVGIGSPALGLPALAVSWQEAWKALFLGKKFRHQPGVYDIADYRLEDVITSIDAQVRSRFVQAVTGRFRSHPEWEQMRSSVKEWCESGFSLVEAARRLHVHRNTLIYRIDKMDREAGLNLRDFRTCLNLYLALMMDRYAGPAVREEDL